MRNRVACAAALLSLALTAVLILRIIAIGKPGVFCRPGSSLERRAARHLEAGTRDTDRLGSAHRSYGVGTSDWRDWAPLCAFNRNVRFGGDLVGDSERLTSHTPSISPTRSEA